MGSRIFVGLNMISLKPKLKELGVYPISHGLNICMFCEGNLEIIYMLSCTIWTDIYVGPQFGFIWTT